MPKARMHIKPTEWKIASCNSCYAHTHSTSRPLGERVDMLYELQIGSMVVTLCDKCCNKLIEVIQSRQKEEGCNE